MAVLLVVAAVLRVFQINNQLWIDEVSALESIKRPAWEILTEWPGASSHILFEFLASVSHELRTPLNSIIGFAEVLDDLAQGDQNADPKRLRYINNILSSGRSLLEMINELLQMAKIEAGRMEVNIEPTSLSDLIEGLSGIIRPQAEAKSIEIKMQVGRNLPMIETDPGKLQQILYNFLSNAVKFTSSGGTVTLTADRLTRQDKRPGQPREAHAPGSVYHGKALPTPRNVAFQRPTVPQRAPPVASESAAPSQARASTCAACTAGRPAPWAICWRQLTPSATSNTSSPAARTAGRRSSSPMAMDVP